MDNHLDDLIHRYLAKTASEAEKVELALLLETSDEEALLKKLESIWLQQNSQEALDLFGERAPQLMQTIFSKDDRHQQKNRSSLAPVLRMPRTIWWRYAVAVLLIVVTGMYMLNQNQKRPFQSSEKKIAREINDVLPGQNKAILTLSSGKKVILDSAASGVIAEDRVMIRNSAGQLAYPASDNVVINTMTTPNGCQYKLILPDGTKVWLNASSSITYPTGFTGKTREVAITGEAYFEVVSNKKHPFIVKSPKELITVVGTKFNVNAYSDEPSEKTSLIEGAVWMENTVLRPGDAFVNGRVVGTNLEQDIAWKNGIFNFDHTPIPVVLRQLARWYNLEIVYAGEVPDVECTGELLRKLNLEQILTVLRQLGVRCNIERNNRLIIE